MRRTVTFLVAHAVIATCLLCAISQMCDRWDHELQTGKDTESTFVVVALCVGALFVLAHAAREPRQAEPLRAAASASGILHFSRPLRGAPADSFLSPSPPAVVLAAVLRI